MQEAEQVQPNPENLNDEVEPNLVARLDLVQYMKEPRPHLITSLEITQPIQYILARTLVDFNNLKCLNIVFTGNPIEPMEKLVSTSLKHLNVSYTQGFPATCVDNIVECENLEFLNIGLGLVDTQSMKYAFEKLCSTVRSKLVSLFFKKYNTNDLNEVEFQNLIFCHFQIRNFAISFQNCTIYSIKYFNLFTFGTVKMLSSCPKLEFISLKGLRLFDSALLNHTICFKTLKHLFLDTCNPMLRPEFEWMVTGMPELHYLRIRNLQTDVEALRDYMLKQQSLLQINFYSENYLPTTYTSDEVVSLLLQARPTWIQRLCVCEFSQPPTSTMPDQKLQLFDRIEIMLIEHLPCGIFPCPKDNKCVDNCPVYCRPDLKCNLNL